MDCLERKLFFEIEKIKIIDTHEHLMERKEIIDQGVGAVELFKYSYAYLDLINSGFRKELFNTEDKNKLFDELEKYQERLKLTSFMRMIKRSINDLYGFTENIVTRENWFNLDKEIKKAYKNEDWYREILQDKCNFCISLLDNYWSVYKIPYNSELFLPVLRADPFILGRNYKPLYPEDQNIHTMVEEIAKEWKISIDTFDEYINLINIAIKKYKDCGSPAIKICTAYERSLLFDNCSEIEARKLYAKNPYDITTNETKKLQDYIAHYIIKEATKNNMPIQIHTGYLARSSAILSNSNPEKLNNLFIMYPDTKFIIFHFGYPYCRSALSLVKIFKNVYIDLCWVPALSDKMAVKMLDECFDLVPSNKIMWGGDAERLEDAYSSAVMFKELIAKVLSSRISKRELTFLESIEIIKSIFYKNANDVYELKNGC